MVPPSELSADPLECLTLGECGPYLYTAYCSACRRSRDVDLAALANRFGGDFPVRDVRKRLRCMDCRSRRIVISFVPRGHSVSIGR